MNQREAKRQAHLLVMQMIDSYLAQLVRPDLDEKIEQALLNLQDYHERRGAEPDGDDVPDRNDYCSCVCGQAKYRAVKEGLRIYGMPAMGCSSCGGSGIPRGTK